MAFFRLDRRDGNRDFDVGLHRHWLDPTVPFALTLAAPAQGVLVTSATLRDAGTGAPDPAWSAAEARVGAPHLPSPAIRAAVASPFDYAAQTRVLVVTDLAQGDIGQLASAFQALFVAAGGGALGLFTAINRLRAVHTRIAPELEAQNIPLYAQHVDAMGNATLVDIFPRRGRTVACSARMRCAMASMCPVARCGWWCSRKCRGLARISYTANGGCICRKVIRKPGMIGSHAHVCVRRSVV